MLLSLPLTYRAREHAAQTHSGLTTTDVNAPLALVAGIETDPSKMQKPPLTAFQFERIESPMINERAPISCTYFWAYL
jgi:hypothetical protein